MPLDPDVLAEELPGLVRYAVYLTRNRADADDLVQDTLERAVARGGTFRGDSSPTTWLHRVMHRRFLDTRRRRTPEPTADEELMARVEAAWRDDAYTVDPEVVLARAEERADLRDALEHLPVILRSAVVLHDMQGLTSAEVATVHGIGVPAAKQRLRRGRALLVTLLADDADRHLAMEGVPMRCSEARSLVGDYLDDELGARERSLLEGHLASCPTCPGLYASIVGVSAAVGRLRDPDSVVPPAIAERLSL
ncbi:sigma-70 family RNA polymerase sigma factor [Phycicoccus sp. HDW14]|uniref:sigma-70 family RNA polymerase sigma factor n=1 Tax=Phycicoccus sp. HDW14 TaxID=2714941 RepID=UPI00140B63DA|nr:sigma-70 family RNA polymerase sigma factor [Phycicoccus sp. HDW14]QIM20127.1 sigma-70 family RNA polymerase sigma factor [Phycicoccus sp. HDW14]